MNKQTSNSVELAIAWTGPLCILGMIFFWGIMGHNIPPPNFHDRIYSYIARRYSQARPVGCH
jgi:hypothetical protein